MKENKITPLANIPSKYIRYEYNTYLSIPQWCLIFIRNDYCEFIKENPNRFFPYFQAIGNFWKSYFFSFKYRKRYSLLSFLYDIKIILLGISMTTEFSVKYIYEKTVGAFTQYFYEARTEQDELMEITDRDYSDFIKYYPWYDFNFFSRWKNFIKKVFKKPSNFSHFVRVLERSLYFTSYLFIKLSLASLIRFIHFVDYHQPDSRTSLELDYLPDNFSEDSYVDTIGEHQKRVVVTVPRYFSFQSYIKRLNKDNYIHSIAGNSEETLIICTLPDDMSHKFVKLESIFIQNNMANYSTRIIYIIKISDLIDFNIYCRLKNIKIEHIFDF